METLDCVVVGAGVIGLAVARAFAKRGRFVVCLDRNEYPGYETSSRNSEVIHAGIYYPKNSLKARTCVAGRHALYDYLETRKVPHKRCGKLIVATREDQGDELLRIAERARDNGVEDLRLMSRQQSKALEPDLECQAALHSPSSGIIDSHVYMQSLIGEIEDAGGAVVQRTAVEAVEVVRAGLRFRAAGAGDFAARCNTLINCTGLHAPDFARRIDGYESARAPVAHYAKGSYCALTGRAPFQRLIYPTPEPGGLGIHLTLDLQGTARFGPDVEWLNVSDPSQIDYSVDEAIVPRFADAIGRWWPQLSLDRLHAAYSGVRPKISGPHEPASDFIVEGPEAHGVDGLVNFFGIESPGLSASLALADHAIALVD